MARWALYAHCLVAKSSRQARYSLAQHCQRLCRCLDMNGFTIVAQWFPGGPSPTGRFERHRMSVEPGSTSVLWSNVITGQQVIWTSTGSTLVSGAPFGVAAHLQSGAFNPKSARGTLAHSPQSVPALPCHGKPIRLALLAELKRDAVPTLCNPKTRIILILTT